MLENEINFNAKFGILAVSANNAESPALTAQTLDTRIVTASLSSIMDLDRRNEMDDEEMTGTEERTRQYEKGATASLSLDITKAKASDLATLLAYGLGAVSTAAAGSGYKHTITPCATRSNPSFTMGQQYGKNLGKRRFAGCYVDSLSVKIGKDSWVTASASIKGSGKHDQDRVKETIPASGTATQLTLSNAVLDDDLANIHKIIGVKDGADYPATITGISGTIVDITSLGLSGTIDYKAVYRKSVAWGTFPTAVEEPAFYASHAAVVINGSFNPATQVLTGGYTVPGAELTDITINLNNNMMIEFLPGTGGVNYATGAIRGGRDNKVTIGRRLYDSLLESKMEEAEYVSLSVKLEHVEEFDTGQKFTVWFVIPRLAISEAKKGVDGKLLTESVTLPIADNGTDETIYVIVKNEVATYAA